MQRIAGNNHHNNQFTEGNTATNGQATQLTADFLNSAQEELVALAQINGDALDTNNNNQAATAINNQISTLNTAINTLDTKTGIQQFDVNINNSSYTDIFHFTQLHSSSSFIVGLASRTDSYISSVQLSVIASWHSKLDVKQLACSNAFPFLIKIIHDTPGNGVMSVKRIGGGSNDEPLRVNVRTLNNTISTTIPSDKSVFHAVYEKYFGYPDNLDIDTPVRIWHNKSAEELLRRGYLPMVGATYNISNLPDYYKSKISDLSTSNSGFSSVITEFDEDNSTVKTDDRRGYYFGSTSNDALIGETEEDRIQNITASLTTRRYVINNFSGALSSATRIYDGSYPVKLQDHTSDSDQWGVTPVNFDASRVARTGLYTRPKTMYVGGIPALYFLRSY